MKIKILLIHVSNQIKTEVPLRPNGLIMILVFILQTRCRGL